MKWKIRVGISVFLGAVLCAAGALAGTESYDDKQEDAGYEVVHINPVASTGYCLREYSGYVAIYTTDGTQPETVTAIEVQNLRKVDRDLLAQGISADTREELMALLEDLGS